MVELKMPKAEPRTGSVATDKSRGSKGEHQLKMPKMEPQGEINSSPKCVLAPVQIDLSSSSSSEDDEVKKESESEYSSEASSDHSDWSDSDEEEYEVGLDDEDEEGRPPRAKKAKIASDRTTRKSEEELSGTPVKKKSTISRVKTTAKLADSSAPKVRNNNPGRRRVGGRVYDSVLGRTCHWCRQKTVELHVECTLCPIRFCGACLLNRNGEKIEEEMLVRWICPKCRGGCGPKCQNCCNCGPCRKAHGLGPTGQLVNLARKAGFSNVHDYLIHQKTDESPEDIALRKKGRNWSRDSGARLHSSLLEMHEVKKEVREEEHEEEEYEYEYEDVTMGVVKESVNSTSHKVKDEPVYVYTDSRKDTISYESRRETVINGPRMESSDRITQSVTNSSVSPSKSTNSPVQTNNGPRMESSDRITRSVTNSSVSPSKSTNSPIQTSISKNPSEDMRSSQASCDTGSHGVISNCTEQSDFAKELEVTLTRPFSMHQMKEMWGHVTFRKPVMRLRQTRSRDIEVPGSVEGQSYLDHYPDLGTKLEKATTPEEKLRLLRGFFFWLQPWLSWISSCMRSCMEGAYRPWRNAPVLDASGDCTEISGPDCEIIRVLFSIDEGERNAPSELEDKKPTIRLAKLKKCSSPEQSISRFPVKVKEEKDD